VVISGYYGFRNAGDEAILAALIDGLREATLVVLSGAPELTRREHGVEAVRRDDPAAVLAALHGADLVISGGGSLLQDTTGPGSIPYYLGIVAAARALGRPVMIYSHGVGPIRSAWGRACLRVLDGVALITTRDEESASLLRACGVHRPVVEVTADGALALPRPARGSLHPVLPPGGRPLIGFAVRAWNRGHHLEVLSRAADRIVERLGGTVVLLPLQRPGDLEASRRVAAHMSHPAWIIDAEFPPRDWPRVFAGLDGLVGMRLHALIFAALAGVPFVAISYDPKVDHFVQSLGAGPALPLDAVTPEGLADAVEVAWTPSPAVRFRLESRLETLQARARRNIELARSLLV
jgi:polysaccharide pyruvyl transferase CsaB